MFKLLKSLALAITFALALWPAAALAQADSTNTLPSGIFESSGRFKVAPTPMIQVGVDSMTGLPCLVGFDVNCVGPSGGSSAITAANGAIVGIGSLGDVACVNASASCGLIQLEKALLAQLLSTNPSPVSGSTASGAALTENPLAEGCRASTTIPTSVTDGQKVNRMCTPEGKAVIVPFAPDALRLRGSASTTANTATTLIAAQGASIKIYVAAVQCFRTDTATTALYVTLNDGASTTVPVPPVTGGAAIVYPIPLVVAANTALTYTPSAGVTTTFCSAQGYQGP